MEVIRCASCCSTRMGRAAMVCAEDGGVRSSRDAIMGANPLAGQLIQFVVPAGVWQAGHLLDGGEYALFGCTVSPGFTGSMYEGGRREALSAIYPNRMRDILFLTTEEDQTSMPEGFAK